MLIGNVTRQRRGRINFARSLTYDAVPANSVLPQKKTGKLFLDQRPNETTGKRSIDRGSCSLSAYIGENSSIQAAILVSKKVEEVATHSSCGDELCGRCLASLKPSNERRAEANTKLTSSRSLSISSSLSATRTTKSRLPSTIMTELICCLSDELA